MSFFFLLLYTAYSLLLINSITSEKGTYSDKFCFRTTRKEDPKEWFCKEYPEFKCESLRKVLEFGDVIYYRAVLDQSKRSKAISKDIEDPIVRTHKHSNNFITFEQEIAYRRVPKTTDTQWSNLWHLNGNILPSMKVSEAWGLGYNGSGIIIGIVDDGLQTDHSDLDENVDTTIDKDVYDDDDDPSPSSAWDSHGTNVGGLVAAEINNGDCTVGVAHQATLVGIRILGPGTVTDSQEAEALGWQLSNIDIYSNSWGPTDGYGFEEPGTITKTALQNGVTNGRDGKGVIFTWAAGNGETSDNCNADGYANSIYTIAITSVQQGENAWYSEVCAAAMAATYGGSNRDQYLTTTTTSSSCISENVQGTSYSTPIASGIIALALQANPKLTWRDIQHLIVLTTTKSGFSDTYSSWQTNGAGKEFSQVLGFGFMDAHSMVTRAISWTTTVPVQQICTTSTFTVSRTTSGSLHSSDSRAIQNSDCSAISYLEHVTVNINFSYSEKRGVTEFYLVSPDGTESHLLHYRYSDAVYYSSAGSLSWTFMSVHFWGENPIGEWTLKFKSYQGLSAVTVTSWSLSLYGTTTNPVPDTDFCVLSPCQNNGTCSNNQYSYSCQCTDDFSGTNCDSTVTSIDDNNTDGSNHGPIIAAVLGGLIVCACVIIAVVRYANFPSRVSPTAKIATTKPNV
ncbi:furin-like isoform X1 [Mytilus edulis]|uniref:furin-like isoform X1 n=1 Tax=Mytilus edulis TaxID=6550 RepID=UPI0039EEAFDF